MLISAKYQHESAIGIYISGASLVAQLVKNLPAVLVEKVPGLGRSLEEGMATHSSILAWRIPMDRGAWRAVDHGDTKSQT